MQYIYIYIYTYVVTESTKPLSVIIVPYFTFFFKLYQCEWRLSPTEMYDVCERWNKCYC